MTGYKMVYKTVDTEPETLWWDVPSEVSLWYRAAEGKNFTSVKYVIWYNVDEYNEGGRPAIKVKDASGTVTELNDVVWTKTYNASEATAWSCQVTGTASIPKCVAVSNGKEHGVFCKRA